MVLSPAIQQNMQAMQGSGGDSAQSALEAEFSNMAYAALQQRVPELMPSVVTFRILETDMDNGHVVGAFVIARKKHILYVPVVLSENKVKPVEIIYSKDLGRFIPLTSKWLAELTKLEDQTMGEAADLPDTVPGDVNLQHMLLPPYSGRHGYAAADIYADMMRTSEEDSKVSSEVKEALHALLKKLPVKEAAGIAQKLLSQPKLAEVYLNVFDGPEAVTSFFCCQEKVAAPVMTEAEYQTVSAAASPARFRKVFGDLGPTAYKMALDAGYVIKEVADREVKIAVAIDDASELKTNTQEPDTKGTDGATDRIQTMVDDLEKPMNTGFYRVYTPDGKTHDVFVITERRNYHTVKGIRPDGARQTILFGNGKYQYGNDIPGTRLSKEAAQKTPIYKYLNTTLKAGGVQRGHGVFLRLDRQDKQDVVGPIRIDRVYSGKETRAECLDGRVYVVQDRDRGGKIKFPDSNVCYLSRQYKFVPLDTHQKISILEDPRDILETMRRGLLKSADFNIKVGHSRANGTYSVNRMPVSRVQAAHYLMGRCKLAAATAEEILDAAEKSARPLEYAIFSSLDKVASIFGPDPEEAGMPEGAPGEAPPMGGASGMSAGVDPNTGLPLDPATGLPVDPNTGMPIDPNTGMPIDPNTGMPVDPATGQLMDQGAAGQQIDPNTGMPMGAGAGGSPGTVTDDVLDAPEINPEFQGNPELLKDPELMDMAHIDMILRSPTLKDIISSYSDVLLKALDHLGRILLAIYMKAPDLKNEVGSTQYQALEAGVRNLFKSMGDTILDLHQNTAVLSQTTSNELADHQSEFTTRAAL